MSESKQRQKFRLPNNVRLKRRKAYKPEEYKKYIPANEKKRRGKQYANIAK